MLVTSLVFFLFCGAGLRCSPISEDGVKDLNGNNIDSESDLIKPATSPDEESGKMVETWEEISGVNPEEMGNYFEGDIMLPPRSVSRNGLRNETFRWENAIIPYVIEGYFSSNAMNLIKKAMDIYHKYTCIRFVQRKSSDVDYIAITSGNSGCWSNVGRVSGKQEVNLQTPACTTKVGTILHELMHACGFYHEQNRPDRDDYVTVSFQNIKSGHESNFKKATPESTNDFGVTYDYRSVMHYSEHAFSKNGKATIIPKVSEASGKMGQRDGFSRKDLMKLNAMYKCPNVPAEFTTQAPEQSNGGGGSSSGGDILSAIFSFLDKKK
ncbi:zinc metalloproteinase nas-13-like [Coccinella septempunctata]|uniref:zinc metalloproteinase nas-13-like n=1 Tax=Coccinella septempunctata TaxID=41139 RepID=UPI001D07501B|nr:zinc metalloproteinase nas-13-like [Coccinella septempunctata]